MINIDALSFRYPQSEFSLSIPGLSVPKGGKVAVIGPSGFGKTTLLNLVAGILVPDSGEIRVAGSSLGSMSSKERRDFRISNIGFVFQDFRLIPYLDVLDNILLPFRINSILKPGKGVKGSAADLAERLGIRDKLEKFPAKLSHGERQRVAICRALVNSPSLILADEPTGNLDPKNKEKIMQILDVYLSSAGATLLHVTHDLDTLQGFSETIDFSSFQNPEL